jgi:putative DNA primase/helicase
MKEQENTENNKPTRLNPADFPHPATPGRGLPTTIENMEHLLNHAGIQPRFNIIKKRLEITRADGSAASMTSIASLAMLNGLNTGWLTQFLEEIGFRHAHNPVLDWINSKPWDGDDRLQALTDTLLEAEDYPRDLKEILLRRWMLSAAQAALSNGRFHAHGVLTFQGPQGIGKTSWIRKLLPPGQLRDDCILLDHHMDGSNKDSQINAVTHLIVEIGELDSSFKKDVARLKGFLTNDCDKIRRPYGKDVMEYPRRTVFAATVNEEKFLVDQTGNRRFWTISLRGINYRHAIDMQQLFAQLAVWLNAGEKWWLTKAEEKQLAEYNQRHKSVSVIAERIADRINLEVAGDGYYRTALEVLAEAGIPYPTNAQCRECGSILRERLGPPKRVQGRDRWRVLFHGETASIDGSAF